MRVAVIGDHCPAFSKTAQKSDLKLLTKAFHAWIDESDKHPIAFLAEDPEVECDPAASDSKTTTSSCVHDLHYLSDSLASKGIAALRNIVRAQPNVLVKLVPTRRLSYLISFLLTAIKFWRPLGDRASDEEDADRIAAFSQSFPDLTWPQLFAEVEAAEKAGAEVLASFPCLLRLKELVEEKINVLRSFEEQGRAYHKEFSEEDPDERYSATFFRSVHRMGDASLERWAAWAETVAYVARDLLFVAQFFSLREQLTALPSGDGGYRIVILVDHNLGTSLTEFLVSSSFSCKAFQGNAERLVPNQVPEKPIHFERRILEQLLSNCFAPRSVEEEGKFVPAAAFRVPTLTLLNCGFFCRVELCSCGSVSPLWSRWFKFPEML